MIDRDRLRSQLKLHEGVRAKPYKDTVGKTTIGCGRNLDDVGLSADEIDFLLGNDISTAEGHCYRLPWFKALDQVRQNAVCELVFNMGPAKFAGFKKFAAAMEDGNWIKAQEELLDSKWRTDVGPIRSTRLANMILTGEFPV